MNQIDDVIIDRELKKLYLDSDFLESFYNALDFIQEDLRALWGSEEAVNFGSYIKKLKEMPNELNEAIYDLGEKALEELKDQLSDYDKAKSDLRMYCVFAKHRDDSDTHLSERIEDSRFQETMKIQFGMNKKQASIAMNKFINRMESLLPTLEEAVSNKRDAFRVFGVSLDYQYQNNIEEVKNKIVDTINEMKERFENLKDKEKDNPMIGRDYTIVSR